MGTESRLSLMHIPEVEISYLHDFDTGPFTLNIPSIPADQYGVRYYNILDNKQGKGVYYDSTANDQGDLQAKARSVGIMNPQNSSNQWYIVFRDSSSHIVDKSPSPESSWSPAISGPAIDDPKWTYSYFFTPQLEGYSITQSTPGICTVAWSWYLLKNFVTVSLGGFNTVSDSGGYIGDADAQNESLLLSNSQYSVIKSFCVVQKAICVVTCNSIQQSNGATITVSTGTSIALNALGSKGTTTTVPTQISCPANPYNWQFYKQSGASWVSASPSTDYTISSGSSTSGTVVFAFNTSGRYKITLQLTGCSPVYNPGFPSGTTNIDEFSLFFNVDIPLTTDIISFPAIIPNITPISGVNSNNQGYAPYKFKVGYTLQGGIWQQQQGSSPPVTLTPSIQDWEDMIKAKCIINCIVRNASTNTPVAMRTGLGPHTFTLIKGEYKVGYEVTLKGGASLVNTFENPTSSI
jgi:hypothetical protein